MKSSILLSTTVAALLLAATPALAGDGNADAPEKVLYHVNDSANAGAAMQNINNHLNASPKAEIVVVTHGKGIDFLLEGAQDAQGNPYDARVQALKAKGVQFAVCNNTLKGRKIDPKSVLPEAKIVPSGVAELGKLQAKSGFVYVKP
ncbi:MAG: DsrE family protein [Betaproteobacteria bacterium]|nr:DsrE family protein [Betaproteobacteria bacterium]